MIARVETEVLCATRDTMVACWGFVRHGLLAVKRKAKGAIVWHPEHLRLALEKGFTREPGGAELWLACSSGTPVAFVITTPEYDPFLNLPMSLYVWISYHDPLVRSDAVPKLEAVIEEVARARGFASLRCMTTRKGLLPRLAPFGWRQVLVVLEKPLYEE